MTHYEVVSRGDSVGRTLRIVVYGALGLVGSVVAFLVSALLWAVFVEGGR